MNWVVGIYDIFQWFFSEIMSNRLIGWTRAYITDQWIPWPLGRCLETLTYEFDIRIRTYSSGVHLELKKTTTLSHRTPLHTGDGSYGTTHRTSLNIRLWQKRMLYQIASGGGGGYITILITLSYNIMRSYLETATFLITRYMP